MQYMFKSSLTQNLHVRCWFSYSPVTIASPPVYPTLHVALDGSGRADVAGARVLSGRSWSRIPLERRSAKEAAAYGLGHR